MMKVCKKCKCYQSGVVVRGESIKNLGECRRGEPDTGDNAWPIIRESDWCGEYEEKK